MKTGTFFRMKMMLLLSIILTECHDSANDDSREELKCPPIGVDGTDGNILGIWQLVCIKDWTGDEGIDYSCDNITYYFQADSILSIRKHAGNLYGTYTYRYFYPRNGFYNLQIDAYRLICRVEKDIMFIIDGNNACEIYIRVEN
ncbi:MAG: hypothetical protein LBD45_08920 [Bacteroidales bacterium]|jgi:hypothetical protein|nr:hypothetical protein [Bacteroidales bacterium]